jgi:hypothetical protein
MSIASNEYDGARPAESFEQVTVARRGIGVALASLLFFAALDHIECTLQCTKLRPA